jgi:hypothetical protein
MVLEVPDVVCDPPQTKEGPGSVGARKEASGRRIHLWLAGHSRRMPRNCHNMH